MEGILTLFTVGIPSTLLIYSTTYISWMRKLFVVTDTTNSTGHGFVYTELNLGRQESVDRRL